MRTIVADFQESRFAPIAELARSVIDAPAGPQGVPRVCARLERIDGQPALVARTLDDAQTTQLVLPESDPRQLEAALAYLIERLTAIGMEVVCDAEEMPVMH
jgi:hypothetical protein